MEASFSKTATITSAPVLKVSVSLRNVSEGASPDPAVAGTVATLRGFVLVRFGVTDDATAAPT